MHLYFLRIIFNLIIKFIKFIFFSTKYLQLNIIYITFTILFLVLFATSTLLRLSQIIFFTFDFINFEFCEC